MQIKKELLKMRDRIDKLTDKDIQLKLFIEFSNDTDYYYIFKIFKQCNIFKIFKVFNNAELIQTKQMLEDTYNTKTIIDFFNLTTKQLKYILQEARYD